MKTDNELFNTSYSPIQKLDSPLFTEKGLHIWIKRDDMIHPAPSGNKWRKLKYNIQAALENGHTTLLTFGGAFSNHIYATAAAGKRFGLQTIGIIRGERSSMGNATLNFAKSCGMQLFFIDRSAYRLKKETSFLEGLHRQFGRVYILQEGGTNALALKGCAEIGQEVHQQLPDIKMDYWAIACGTGGSFAGLLQGIAPSSRGIGISVLKGNWMAKEVAHLLRGHEKEAFPKWQIEPSYHHGGYAKFTPELIRFINTFKKEYGIPLDPIYTGKLFFAIWEMAKKNVFPEGSQLCVVHTGGLQGIQGFNDRFGEKAIIE